MKNEQEFSYFGRVRVKKLVHNVKLRLASLNIGSLTGKGMELVDTLIRRRVNIACLQETKWVGSKAKELENTGYKIYYTGLDRRRNGVGIVVDKDLKDDVITVSRKGDRIILVKLVLGGNIINIISVYAPQVGLDEHIKTQFWESMDELMRGIPQGEHVFIGGDVNTRVGKDHGGYEIVHVGHGFGDRNNFCSGLRSYSSKYLF